MTSAEILAGLRLFVLALASGELQHDPDTAVTELRALLAGVTDSAPPAESDRTDGVAADA